VPTEPGDDAGRWASLQSQAGSRSLSEKERERLHDLTSQRHLLHGRWVILGGTFSTILVILIGAGLLIAFGTMTVANAKDLFSILLPPLFTLLGAAATLYFNSDDR
jgi:hypothetical protein